MGNCQSEPPKAKAKASVNVVSKASPRKVESLTSLQNKEADLEEGIRNLLIEIREKTIQEGDNLDNSISDKVIKPQHKPSTDSKRLTEAAAVAGINKNITSEVNIKLGEVDIPRTQLKIKSIYSADQISVFKAALDEHFPDYKKHYNSEDVVSLFLSFIEYSPEALNDDKRIKKVKNSLNEILSTQNKLQDMSIISNLKMKVFLDADYKKDGVELKIIIAMDRSNKTSSQSDDDYPKPTPSSSLIESLVGKSLYEGHNNSLTSNSQSNIEFGVNIGDFLKDSYTNNTAILELFKSGLRINSKGVMSPSFMKTIHSLSMMLLSKIIGNRFLESRYAKLGERICSIKDAKINLETRDIERVASTVSTQVIDIIRSCVRNSNHGLSESELLELENEISMTSHSITSLLTSDYMSVSMSELLKSVTNHLKLEKESDGTFSEPSPTQRYVRDIVFGLSALGDVRIIRLWSPIQHLTVDAVGFSPFKVFPCSDSDLIHNTTAHVKSELELQRRYSYPILHKLNETFSNKGYYKSPDNVDFDSFRQYVATLYDEDTSESDF